MLDYHNEWLLPAEHRFPLPETTTGRIWLEIGCGNGHFLAAMLRLHPEISWVALEYKRKRVLKTLEKLKKLGEPAVTLIYGDFFTLAPKKLPPQAFERILLNFPDPWPKKRHAKKRLVGPSTLPWLYDLLLPGGMLCVATDAPDFAAQILDLLEADPRFVNLHPPYRRERPEFPGTLYLERWQRERRELPLFDYR